MNKISFTAEHSSRLFEMLVFFYKNELINVSNDGNISFKVFHEDDGIPEIKMHWLEVCMTHLASKLIFRSGKPLHFCKDTYFRFTDNLMKTFFQEDKQIHPIDFLYKEFEKNFKDDSK